MTRHANVRVAATYDVTLDDSDNIEDFTPSSGDTYNIPGIGLLYFSVVAEPVYTEGEQRLDGNAGESFAGYPQVRYLQPMCHIDSYTWLIANYRGQVTASLRTNGTTYASYNCMLRFEKTQITRPNWLAVTWIFTIIEAL